ncbi:hypothetical protein HPB50_019280 [Hyalomma asiaticum]|uniref:Uncharacterized protein n=1 Tax=Hyalomma asiaticum TaxID=266040 RepID=A0ACB7RUA2_HYAAI|nr:hypothetical protein HPB50_019280 [Hyalomma asiaticum]
MASRRPSHGSRSGNSASSRRQGEWLTLSQWVSSRSASDASLSSTILKISEQEADDSSEDPSEAPSSDRGRSRTGRPRTADNTGSSRSRHEGAERNRQRESGSSSGTPPPAKSPRHESGQSHEAPPSSDTTARNPRTSNGRDSFWGDQYFPMRTVPDISVRSLAQNQQGVNGEGSSRHPSPFATPGSTERQSLWVAHTPHDEGSPRRRSTGSSTSRQGDVLSAKKTASEPEPARPQQSTRRRSTRSGASASFRPEEPGDNRASTSTGGTDNKTKAKSAVKVDAASRYLGDLASLRPTIQGSLQRGTPRRKRPAGYGVLKEIRRLRSGTRNLIPRLSFARVDASEAFLVTFLEGSYVITHNARRVTVMPRDMATLYTVITNYGSLLGPLLVSSTLRVGVTSFPAREMTYNFSDCFASGDDFRVIKCPQLAESLSEGDIRWNKGGAAPSAAPPQAAAPPPPPAAAPAAASGAGEVRTVKCPQLAESLSEGDIRWSKAVGDTVAEDEVICEVETDKTSVPIHAPASGVILEILAPDGTTVQPGKDIFRLQVGGAGGAPAAARPAAAPAAPAPTPVTSTPPPAASAGPIPTTPPPIPVVPSGPMSSMPVSSIQVPGPGAQAASAAAPAAAASFGARTEQRVKMNRMRQRIAQRLKDAQDTYAMLTTFNEVDMT